MLFSLYRPSDQSYEKQYDYFFGHKIDNDAGVFPCARSMSYFLNMHEFWLQMYAWRHYFAFLFIEWSVTISFRVIVRFEQINVCGAQGLKYYFKLAKTS